MANRKRSVMADEGHKKTMWGIPDFPVDLRRRFIRYVKDNQQKNSTILLEKVIKEFLEKNEYTPMKKKRVFCEEEEETSLWGIQNFPVLLRKRIVTHAKIVDCNVSELVENILEEFLQHEEQRSI